MSGHRWAGRPGHWVCKRCDLPAKDPGSLHPSEVCSADVEGSLYYLRARSWNVCSPPVAALAPKAPVQTRLDTGERVAGGPVGSARGALPERVRVGEDLKKPNNNITPEDVNRFVDQMVEMAERRERNG